MALNEKVLCWANGDRCPGCAHYWGKADQCTYKPKRGFWMAVNSLGRWLQDIARDRLSTTPETEQ